MGRFLRRGVMVGVSKSTGPERRVMACGVAIMGSGCRSRRRQDPPGRGDYVVGAKDWGDVVFGVVWRYKKRVEKRTSRESALIRCGVCVGCGVVEW